MFFAVFLIEILEKERVLVSFYVLGCFFSDPPFGRGVTLRWLNTEA